jgi:nucleoside-diphosphate-sugar epimerase
MRIGLVGSTGFVGTTLQRQVAVDATYHRSDIADIDGEAFELLVCAGAPAEKWRANKEPEADRENLEVLVGHLREARADHLLLISTVDVYPTPVGVDEDTPIDPTEGSAYGRHRLWLEDQCRAAFDRTSVVRLPGLFGSGLKKNVLFDLLGDRELGLTHPDSAFQFYDMSRLWADLQVVIDRELELVNFATAPVTVRAVAERCFGVPFPESDGTPVTYDMQTRHADAFGGVAPYLMDAESELEAIGRWVAEERAHVRDGDRASDASAR